MVSFPVYCLPWLDGVLDVRPLHSNSPLLVQLPHWLPRLSNISPLINDRSDDRADRPRRRRKRARYLTAGLRRGATQLLQRPGDVGDP